jgi:hypothetical protein
MSCACITAADGAHPSLLVARRSKKNTHWSRSSAYSLRTTDFSPTRRRPGLHGPKHLPAHYKFADYFRRVDVMLARRDEATRLRLLPMRDDEARNIVNGLLGQRARGVGFVGNDEPPADGVQRLSRIARRETHRQVLAACARWLASRA